MRCIRPASHSTYFNGKAFCIFVFLRAGWCSQVHSSSSVIASSLSSSLPSSHHCSFLPCKGALLKNGLGVCWTRNPSNNIQRHTRKEERPPADLLAFLRQLREVKEFPYRKTPTRNKDLMCGELLWGPGFVRRAGRSGTGSTRTFSPETNAGHTNRQQQQLSHSPNAISRYPFPAQHRNSH